MKTNFKFLLIIFYFQITICDILLPKSGKEGWSVLKDKDIWVGYTYNNDLPWVRAISLLPHSTDEINPVVGNFDVYDKIFERIIISDVIDSTKNIVYLKIDMPIFNHRDYIVQYSSSNDEDDLLYQWYSITHEKVPEYDNIVRLKRASGEWRLTPISSTSTLVSYTWNGELLGNFPDFYLTTAWETQGSEIIEWLNSALDK